MQSQEKLSSKDKKLIEIAKKHARASFQKDFTSIAAAAETESGKIYTGINLKYPVRSCAMCAGRLAIFKALDDGKKKLNTVVEVKYFSKNNSYKVMNPCGECRQVLLYHSPINIIVETNNGFLRSINIEKLIPYHFQV